MNGTSSSDKANPHIPVSYGSWGITTTRDGYGLLKVMPEEGSFKLGYKCKKVYVITLLMIAL